jgi:predicted Fe-Mo cluster-binding NifX family protein
MNKIAIHGMHENGLQILEKKGIDVKHTKQRRMQVTLHNVSFQMQVTRLELHT